MKKLLNVLVIACTMLFTACEYYDHAITDHEDRLGQLEDVYINGIKEQVDGINTSIAQLEAVDTVLQALTDSLEMEVADLLTQLEANTAADTTARKALEAEIDSISILIETLQAEDEALDQKIADLKEYVDDGITFFQGWTEATFATLEQYAELQTEIAIIRELIETYKEEITASYTQAIEEAIATSEASMKTWVNETLAESYYDIATVDALLATLEGKVDSVDEAIAAELVAQKEALDQAKADITEAYRLAIAEAIEENNGKISQEIADAVKAAADELDAKIATISAEVETIKVQIEAIKEDIENIKVDIADIDAQIEGINTSINQLEAVDSILQALIDNLEAEAEILRNELDANTAADEATKQALEEKIDNINTLIAALLEEDKALDQKIDTLRNHVEGELSYTKDWAVATFATLEQYNAMQTEIAKIKALIDLYKEELTEAYAKAIEDANRILEESEISMKAWVNETLAAGYYDIATIDGILNALESKVDSTDNALIEQIAAQQAALEQAKADIEDAYKQAITEAIEKNNGKITQEIADAVMNAQNALQSQIEAINAELETIKAEIEAIKGDIENIKMAITDIDAQIEGINTSIEQLEEVDAELQALIANLEAEAENLQAQIDANTEADEATKKALQEEIANINALVEALQAKDEELDQKIADLKSYVDNEIAATKDWAEATFATLEQYDAMQIELAELATLIETYKTEITEAYTKDIKDAIAASESGMKTWVNEMLAEGYYDIAAIDAKLATLAADAKNYTDEQLDDAIANQQAALERAKDELTAAYKKAIQEALANNEANNAEFETKIAAAKAELQNQINAINTKLAAIESRLAALEEKINALETRIQSIRFLPEYSDGKVDLTSMQATLTFVLTPSDAAHAIAQAYQSNKGIVNAYISRTKARTRAVDTPEMLTITSINGDANGILEVDIDASSLPADYWAKTTNANIYIHIADGNNDIVSEIIPAFCTTTVINSEGVDLGLSVKWATCNVGATSPEEFGGYYAWGETEEKSAYNSSTYDWSYSNTTLDAENDVAHTKWGDEWRTPTVEEMKELREGCTWEWTTVNGVYGYKVSGNGNSIFLPAAGFRFNDRVYDQGGTTGYGYYWSAALNSGDNNKGNILEFYSRGYYQSSGERYLGYTIRPVCP